MAKSKSRALNTSVFMSIETIKKSMIDIKIKQQIMTESVLWHSLKFSNVAMFDGMDRASVSVFESKLRGLIPVKWSKDDNCYKFDSDKAEQVKSEIGFFEDVTDIEFKQLLASYKKPVAIKTDNEKKEAAKKQAATVIKKFKELGLTKAELIALVNAGYVGA